MNINTHKKKTEQKNPRLPLKKHLRTDVALALFLIRSSLPLWGVSEHSHAETRIPLSLPFHSPHSLIASLQLIEKPVLLVAFR